MSPRPPRLTPTYTRFPYTTLFRSGAALGNVPTSQGMTQGACMKELRIGLVLYGGVSLAVYMNGIATEFWSALRASRSHTGTGGAALGGTPEVYRDLLQELEALPSGAELDRKSTRLNSSH